MSATGSSGRRRTTARLYTAEDQALNQIAREAEARLAAKRAARAEAREIRMRELEKQQREADEQSDRHYEIMNDISTRPMTSRVSTKSSGSSYSSRRSSEDSIEVDRDMKAQLSDIEEKFRKAMVSNAQLDNEKTTLTYQVETLKDEFEELEENTVQLQREHKDKCRELDLLKRDYEKLKQENNNLLEQLQEREKLIEEHGLVLVGGEEINNIDEDETDTPKGVKERNPAALVSPEAAQILESAGDGSLDVRLKKFAEDKQDLLDQIRRLKLELEEEKTKNATLGLSPGKTLLNGPEMQLLEVQREANKQISEYKFRLQKAEQDISTLQGNINRLDSQVKRYKSAADKADVVEDELKAEKRKLQREYREAQARIEELETANSHLQKRLDKLKTSRNAMTRS